MSRDLDALLAAEVAGNYVRPAFFVHCNFDSGALNLWTGMGSIIVGGRTYTGVGTLLDISGIEESTDLSAKGIKVTLSGVLSSLVLIARDEDYQGRALEVLFGAINSTGSLVSDPFIMFSGFMDTMTINDGGETATITLTVENRLIEFDRTSVRRYTSEDQQIEYPGDLGLEFVADLEEKEIVWGRLALFNGGGTGDPPTDTEDPPNLP
jgi:hypothetical protein